MAKSKKRKLRHHAAPKHSSKPFKPTTKPSKTSTTPAAKPAPTIPFHPSDRILLIGEGDFSFAQSLVSHHNCTDLTATCLDTREELHAKYSPQAAQHTAYLEDAEQTVLYGVDATKLGKTKALTQTAGPGFDAILFNFPHIGGKSTDVNRQVRANQALLVGFFAAAKELLAPLGNVVVTLFEGEPYSLWNVRDLARHCGLEVRTSFRFAADAYPGYAHARTLGNLEGGGGWKGEERDARSFVLSRKGVDKVGKIGGKRKRGNESEGEEG